MSEPRTGDRDEVEIEIGERVYRYVLNTRALMMAQAHFAVGAERPDINQIIKRARSNSIEHQVVLFWVGLLKHEPTLTLDQAYELVDRKGGVNYLAWTFQEPDKVTGQLQPDPDDATELEETAAKGEGENPSQAQIVSIGASSSSEPVGSV